mmetsp:Transcript_44757/g.142524  ORF Transcript_44757/g.142524 Transcript_44757/m.142524 type:complete len:252 (-) Transcript_44757:701-1456(-)
MNSPPLPYPCPPFGRTSVRREGFVGEPPPKAVRSARAMPHLRLLDRRRPSSAAPCSSSLYPPLHGGGNPLAPLRDDAVVRNLLLLLGASSPPMPPPSAPADGCLASSPASSSAGLAVHPARCFIMRPHRTSAWHPRHRALTALARFRIGPSGLMSFWVISARQRGHECRASTSRIAHPRQMPPCPHGPNFTASCTTIAQIWQVRSVGSPCSTSVRDGSGPPLYETFPQLSASSSPSGESGLALMWSLLKSQ